MKLEEDPIDDVTGPSELDTSAKDHFKTQERLTKSPFSDTPSSVPPSEFSEMDFYISNGYKNTRQPSSRHQELSVREVMEQPTSPKQTPKKRSWLLRNKLKKVKEDPPSLYSEVAKEEMEKADGTGMAVGKAPAQGSRGTARTVELHMIGQRTRKLTTDSLELWDELNPPTSPREKVGLRGPPPCSRAPREEGEDKTKSEPQPLPSSPPPNTARFG
eukprot:CAMPEP_0206377298 /NCGR_PEP_ID=MMETSP0294-20121207/10069_1 /ASSEMBLY_ACC=CAM_ASM_000327 /TAXON_ID=39354 /ORGANISM="Heterosigma akashiwo, Strain CCMP2393" /LENGTH=215 /DNA_ID=CAMNT_0053825737 /DNA_START=157 /DNA_END=801 /DNA_ORIENTATION=-